MPTDAPIQLIRVSEVAQKYQLCPRIELGFGEKEQREALGGRTCDEFISLLQSFYEEQVPNLGKDDGVQDMPCETAASWLTKRLPPLYDAVMDRVANYSELRNNGIADLVGEYEFTVDLKEGSIRPNSRSDKPHPWLLRAMLDVFSSDEAKYELKPGDPGMVQVVKPDGSRQDVRIGKLFSRKKLDPLVDEDIHHLLTTKSSSGKTNVQVVISNDPYDVLRKSEGQGWTSCERLSSGNYWKGVLDDIRYNNAVAIMRVAAPGTDYKESWTARAMLRWCNSFLGGEKMVGLEPRIYGGEEKTLNPVLLKLMKRLLNEQGKDRYHTCKTPYYYKGFSDEMMGKNGRDEGDKGFIFYGAFPPVQTPLNLKGKEYFDEMMTKWDKKVWVKREFPYSFTNMYDLVDLKEIVAKKEPQFMQGTYDPERNPYVPTLGDDESIVPEDDPELNLWLKSNALHHTFYQYLTGTEASRDREHTGDLMFLYKKNGIVSYGTIRATTDIDGEDFDWKIWPEKIYPQAVDLVRCSVENKVRLEPEGSTTRIDALNDCQKEFLRKIYDADQVEILPVETTDTLELLSKMDPGRTVCTLFKKDAPANPVYGAQIESYGLVNYNARRFRGSGLSSSDAQYEHEERQGYYDGIRRYCQLNEDVPSNKKRWNFTKKEEDEAKWLLGKMRRTDDEFWDQTIDAHLRAGYTLRQIYRAFLYYGTSPEVALTDPDAGSEMLSFFGSLGNNAFKNVRLGETYQQWFKEDQAEYRQLPRKRIRPEGESTEQLIDRLLHQPLPERDNNMLERVVSEYYTGITRLSVRVDETYELTAMRGACVKAGYLAELVGHIANTLPGVVDWKIIDGLNSIEEVRRCFISGEHLFKTVMDMDPEERRRRLIEIEDWQEGTMALTPVETPEGE